MLSQEQIEEVTEAFALFDKDGDGSITTKEIGIVMKSLGQEAEDHEIEEMIKEFDADGNGEIDFQEFLEMMRTRVLQASPDEVIQEVFDVFDCDHKGFVTTSDLIHVMTKLGEDPNEAKELFEAADVNGDGTIDYSEFVQLMTVR